jgi:hypothetical protein
VIPKNTQNLAIIIQTFILHQSIIYIFQFSFTFVCDAVWFYVFFGTKYSEPATEERWSAGVWAL